MTGEIMQVQAEGWNHYIERRIERRWAPVCRAWFPEGATESIDWTWTFFQYVFPLADQELFRVSRHQAGRALNNVRFRGTSRTHAT
jgi:hypothetical protein